VTIRIRRVGAISEAEFQAQVIDLAHLHHWRVAHFRKVRVQRANGTTYYETPAAADGAGWPDLVLVRRGVLIVAELKTDAGSTTGEQVRWLESLRGAGVNAVIWRPCMWAEIEEALQ
jgi:hypothetical protein